MNIGELKHQKISKLAQMAKKFDIHGAAGMRKQDLIFARLYIDPTALADFYNLAFF